MEAFLEGIKNIIEANPHTRKDYYHIVFNEYGDHCLQVMLYCFLKVPDWAMELVERQNIYLEILRLAKTLELEFAFPTQTIHVESFSDKDIDREIQKLEKGELSQTAEAFGPGGKEAQPGGLGDFHSSLSCPEEITLKLQIGSFVIGVTLRPKANNQGKRLFLKRAHTV